MYTLKLFLMTCLLLHTAYPAKTAGLIEMPFRLRTWVGPRNRVLDGVHMPHGKWQFCKVTAVICAKTAEPVEMPFGLWAWMCPRNHVLDGFQIPHGKGQF